MSELIAEPKIVEGLRIQSFNQLKEAFDRGDECYYCKSLITKVTKTKIRTEGENQQSFTPWLPAVRIVKQ